MKMQKIFFNRVSKTIEELLDYFTEDGEIDYDNLGACLDSDTLDKAIESFSNAYNMFDLVERYLQLADKPIEVTI